MEPALSGSWGAGNVCVSSDGMFYYCEAVSEQRAARCIAATGALLERGFRETWSHCTHAHAWKCQAHARVAKSVAKGRSHRGVCLICGKKDSHAIRYEDQDVRRSNTELTDEGPQGDPIH
jgi:hypothetical protein